MDNGAGDDGLMLKVSDNDLSNLEQQELRAAIAGEQVLDDAGLQAVEDFLPRAIMNKLRKIKPPDFTIREVEIKFTVKASLCGVGVDSDVKVKFAPK